MLKIYNSFTRQKEDFKPLIPGKIGIYVCGMTVYDYCHLGHARVLVAFDVITRYLRALKYDVTYVRNVTDIDDKIIKRANENKETITTLTERFIEAMHEDAARLGVLPPSIEPKATLHIEEMLTLIQQLLDKGYAYRADNGDIYYHVARFAPYGQLAHKDLENLRAGERVAVIHAKQDPLDFVLWKMAKPDEPSWDSPWGKGRPGWHIECSAMSMKCLGEHFDIHGGGFDLTFPHHENEIAQSEGATGKKFVNTWMHVGFVQINEEKMSKSLGNFLTIREILDQYPAEVVRYLLLSSHYRSPLQYSDDALKNSAQALERFYLSLRNLPAANAPVDSEYEQKFFAAMSDDFNTPEAIAVLFDLVREINRQREQDIQTAAQLGALLQRLGGIFGILQANPNDYLRQGVENEQEILALIKRREAARQNKQWQEADNVRAELTAMGIALEDTAQGTIWRKE